MCRFNNRRSSGSKDLQRKQKARHSQGVGNAANNQDSKSRKKQHHRLDFKFNNHSCIAFEMLDKSLWVVMVERLLIPFTLNEIRPVIHQLIDALRSIGVIHTDLKPDNIMFVNHMNQPLKLKLIDFGQTRREGCSKLQEKKDSSCEQSDPQSIKADLERLPSLDCLSFLSNSSAVEGDVESICDDNLDVEDCSSDDKDRSSDTESCISKDLLTDSLSGYDADIENDSNKSSDIKSDIDEDSDTADDDTTNQKKIPFPSSSNGYSEGEIFIFDLTYEEAGAAPDSNNVIPVADCGPIAVGSTAVDPTDGAATNISPNNDTAAVAQPPVQKKFRRIRKFFSRLRRRVVCLFSED
ncbi:Homeodomain-interacting protein kinase 1 [Collichthys lucidus]|uniref:Homeodomain-interacting protein kinase 1 n=1 Tax=Collichthys lucidus TaxID=240159 RepID=A0A4U5V918_COLLU|nr:Homeodomain-interacting protein kinase 1 [Collichthys lucidus]